MVDWWLIRDAKMDAKAPFFSNIRHELWKLVEQLQIIKEEKIEKIEIKEENEEVILNYIFFRNRYITVSRHRLPTFREVAGELQLVGEVERR